MESQSHTTNPPCSAYPKTPERYYLQPSEATTSSHGLRFPPDVHRRPLGNNNNNNTQQRTRAPPPAPLSLDAQHHPAVVQLPSIEQPHATQEMRVSSPPSPTSSSTSSLSLYSSDSAKKSLGVIQEEEEGEERKKGGGGFCMCFNFSALFGTKSKPNKSQEPVIVAEPAPAPQMVQPRRRPPSLVLVQ